MPNVDIFDGRGGRKLNANDRALLARHKFKYHSTTETRRFDKFKPVSPTNREKCTKQEIVRDKDNNIIGIKSYWSKI